MKQKDTVTINFFHHKNAKRVIKSEVSYLYPSLSLSHLSLQKSLYQDRTWLTSVLLVVDSLVRN